MGKVDQKNALALCARQLRLGFEDRMASAGLRFQLATRSRLTLRGMGMERGLDLQLWPEAGFDDFYEACAVRTWLGKSIEIGSVPGPSPVSVRGLPACIT